MNEQMPDNPGAEVLSLTADVLDEILEATGSSRLGGPTGPDAIACGTTAPSPATYFRDYPATDSACPTR